jgi:CBS domain-containing protein
VGQKVEQAMTTNVRTVTPDASVVDAARIMRDEDTGSVPVVDDGRVAGIVTDRDIVLRGVADGRDVTALDVREVCSSDPVTVEPGRDLDEALRLMAQHQVRRLPVVDGDRLVGVLAQADVARATDDRATGALVDDISQPGRTT